MFEFSSSSDQDLFNSFSSLIKSNNGQFKSIRQSNFLFKRFSDQLRKDGNDLSTVKKYFGIEVIDGQVKVDINASMRWADYGTRSFRPITWVFILDRLGIVAKYKLKYIGDMKKGTCPDPEKTELLWKREGELLPLEDSTEAVEKDNSQFVGSIGERIIISGTIENVSQFTRAKYHYYDSGIGHVTRINSNGNIIVYFGDIGNVGDNVTFKATIKNHEEYNGKKQTVISRPSFKKEK